MKHYIPKITAGVLLFFGALTLFLSSSIILDLFGLRAKEGNYVLFVVWANFISSIIYLAAAVGLLKSKKWTAPILFASTLLLAVAFVGLLVHINNGGLYETKTIGAMIFRTLLTLVFSSIAYLSIHTKHINHD